VVEAGSRRIFHGGDTIFHGFWWPIATRFQPFDAVFLPVNGAICNFPHRQPPSPFPAAMNPEQAAVSAAMLGARLAVPIHYDAIGQDGLYEQADDPASRFLVAAGEQGIPGQVAGVGEWLELDVNDPSRQMS
ncbi:MAG: MBL fold metallo-hydrolase, partial [Actinomycetota bacterium]|nr:MBL fold metallo-hydrolase [Actinomycetota bacterium]